MGLCLYCMLVTGVVLDEDVPVTGIVNSRPEERLVLRVLFHGTCRSAWDEW